MGLLYLDQDSIYPDQKRVMAHAFQAENVQNYECWRLSTIFPLYLWIYEFLSLYLQLFIGKVLELSRADRWQNCGPTCSRPQ